MVERGKQMKNVKKFILWNIVPALVFIAAKTYQIPELVNVTLVIFWFVSLTTTFILLPVMAIAWNTIKNNSDKVTIDREKMITRKESLDGNVTSVSKTTVNIKSFDNIPELGTPRYYVNIVYDLTMVLVFINYGHIYLAIFYWLHIIAQYKTIELSHRTKAFLETIEADEKEAVEV